MIVLLSVLQVFLRQDALVKSTEERQKWIEILSQLAFMPPTSHIRPELTKRCLKQLTRDKDHYYEQKDIHVYKSIFTILERV